MSTAVVDLDDLDLYTSGDPHAVWARLRREAPVYFNDTPNGGYWALTRYADVNAVYVDPATYSSKNGTVLGGSYRSDRDTASGQMLICSDPPAHRQLRQHVHQAFGQRMMDVAAGYVADYLGAALDRMTADGGGDFATDIAPQLPAGLLAAMFTIGHADALHLLRLTRTMIGFRDPEYTAPEAPEAMILAGAQVEIFDFMTDLLAARRREPADDLISILLAARTNGRPLTDSQILYNALNVAVGGDETTPFTASAIVETLMAHEREASRLHADHALLGTAVDEFFRWTSTNAYVCRTTTREVEIRGVPIPAGATLTLWNASANRDEDEFPHADRLDVGRTPNHHLAFGVANHRCVGMPAARMEITLLVREFLRRGLRFAPAGPVERLRSNFMLGIRHLPVTVSQSEV
ncbi:cytochrome P450 [Catenulispora acidiphila DSM 44928]|uniref:Cytochrome P450 n=1 Tax=Catenulispora acidiphila (strain DSM 44928 / JCM 14897 / NBRC 102108 / NRRL B-24433 / ID139908) TaxID=479433 RepID=C7Q906_CATAD|nr:cytochrome P450 [Catenulispora acidiphila]ACU72326.1 cytochrome P450 [Catenulispora acidiphila DSM 44928]